MSPQDFSEHVARTRLIVVEDSFPVADGLKFMLETGGCDVVGLASNVRTALTLIAATPFDVALLDIDLRGENVAPIAEAVRQRGKPVIFLSGYGDAAILPPHLRTLPRLEKPVEPDQLFAVIDRARADARAET